MNYLKCEYQRFCDNDVHGTSKIETGLYLKPCEHDIDHYVITENGEIITVEKVIIDKNQVKRILEKE